MEGGREGGREGEGREGGRKGGNTELKSSEAITAVHHKIILYGGIILTRQSSQRNVVCFRGVKLFKCSL